MAQIVVDTGVMLDKANTLETAATSIEKLYGEMLQEVNGTAGKMRGKAIDAQREQFKKMEPTFKTIAMDMKSYSKFLTNAAEYYAKIDKDGKTMAEGDVF